MMSGRPEAMESALVKPSLEELLEQIESGANGSPYLAGQSSGQLARDRRPYSLPRYVFNGPIGGGDTIRIGIFAAIHGDEPEGAMAVAPFIRLFHACPDIIKGYGLFFYPVCNPTGFEDGTRHSRNGKDLNREFWHRTDEPEVQYLEAEILSLAFDGIITLHGDDTSSGLYGLVGGSVLSENLLEPALRAAERFLPRNRGDIIDGFQARNGIITDGYKGMLKHAPTAIKPPFEITFETPAKAPSHLQVEAFAAALKTILVEYRSLISVGQNI